MMDRTGGIKQIGTLNRPVPSWLKGCVRSATFSEVGGPDCYNPRSHSGKFCHGLVLEKFAE